MREKNQRGSRLLIWCVFIVLAGGICYLSFQNRELSVEMSEKLLNFLHNKLGKYMPLNMEAALESYLIRQMGRGALFFALGVIATAALTFSFPKLNGAVRVIIITLFLGSFSYFTEKMKDYIENRHYQTSEVIISFLAGLCGFLCVNILFLLFRALLNIFKRRRKGGEKVKIK